MSRYLLIAVLALPRMGSAEACTTNAECDDGSVCTGIETCQAGVCIPGTPLTCNDGNACTLDSCDATNGCTYTPTNGCRLTGKDLEMGATQRLRLKVRLGPEMTGAAFPANNTADDPVQNAASLRVYTTTGDLFDNTYPMPVGNWRYLGNPGDNSGYKYKDFQLVSGPISSVLIRPGKPALIKARGPLLNFTLTNDPEPVNVVLRFGNSGRLYCVQFGGLAKFKPGGRFQSRGSDAPTACPPQ